MVALCGMGLFMQDFWLPTSAEWFRKRERERDDMCTDHYLIRKFPCCVTGEMFAHAQVHDVWIG